MKRGERFLLYFICHLAHSHAFAARAANHCFFAFFKLVRSFAVCIQNALWH
jgi:hypothetical protein